jgi:hypothetical protein
MEPERATIIMVSKATATRQAGRASCGKVAHQEGQLSICHPPDEVEGDDGLAQPQTADVAHGDRHHLCHTHTQSNASRWGAVLMPSVEHDPSTPEAAAELIA